MSRHADRHVRHGFEGRLFESSPRGSYSGGRGVLMSGIVASAIALPALAGPTGERVVHGSAEFARDGNNTTITTSDQAIINFDSFNIGAPETVRFIQPGASSRVLNRVQGAAPTQIDGTLLANGQVFIINPAGVIFGGGSFVDVGRLFAAAGTLSDADFIAGENRFTDLRGSVINQGTIQTRSGAHLAGAHVANFGTVVADSGMISFSSGDEVYIGERNGRIFAEVAPTSVLGSRVENAGLVDAGGGTVSLGAGDHVALALHDSSVLRGGSIRLAGGAGADVQVRGTVDASAGGEPSGGSVDIRGGDVTLTGAAVDASGAQGGGEVSVWAEETLLVDAASTISLDATELGDGGTASLRSGGFTYFGGAVSGRGGASGGDGGFAEVGSRGVLSVDGSINLDASAGGMGTARLMARSAHIVDSASPAATAPGGMAVSTISLDQLTALGAGTVELVMPDNIVFSADEIQTGVSSFTILAGRSIILNDGVTVRSSGTLTARANDPTAAATGTRMAGPGNIQMGAGSGFEADGDITLEVNTGTGFGGGITLANSTSSTGSIMVRNRASSAPGGSAITLGGLATLEAPMGVTLNVPNSAGGVSLTGFIDGDATVLGSDQDIDVAPGLFIVDGNATFTTAGDVNVNGLFIGTGDGEVTAELLNVPNFAGFAGAGTLNVSDIEVAGSLGAQTLTIDTPSDVEIGVQSGGAGVLGLATAELAENIFVGQGALTIRSDGSISVLDEANGPSDPDLLDVLQPLDLTLEGTTLDFASDDASGVELAFGELTATSTAGDIALGMNVTGLRGDATLNSAGNVTTQEAFIFNPGGAGTLGIAVADDAGAGDIGAASSLAFEGAASLTNVDSIIAGDGLRISRVVQTNGQDMLGIDAGSTFTLDGSGEIRGLAGGGILDVTANAFSVRDAENIIEFAGNGTLGYRGPVLTPSRSMLRAGEGATNLELESTSGNLLLLGLGDTGGNPFAEFTSAVDLISATDILFAGGGSTQSYVFTGPLSADAAGGSIGFTADVSALRGVGGVADTLTLNAAGEIVNGGAFTFEGGLNLMSAVRAGGDLTLDLTGVDPTLSGVVAQGNAVTIATSGDLSLGTSGTAAADVEASEVMGIGGESKLALVSDAGVVRLMDLGGALIAALGSDRVVDIDAASGVGFDSNSGARTFTFAELDAFSSNGDIAFAENAAGVTTDASLNALTLNAMNGSITTADAFTFRGGLNLRSTVEAGDALTLDLRDIDPTLGAIMAGGPVMFSTPGNLRVGDGTGMLDVTPGAGATITTSHVMNTTGESLLEFRSETGSIEFANLDGGLLDALAMSGGAARDVRIDANRDSVDGTLAFRSDVNGAVYEFGTLDLLVDERIEFGGNVDGIRVTGGPLELALRNTGAMNEGILVRRDDDRQGRSFTFFGEGGAGVDGISLGDTAPANAMDDMLVAEDGVDLVFDIGQERIDINAAVTAQGGEIRFEERVELAADVTADGDGSILFRDGLDVITDAVVTANGSGAIDLRDVLFVDGGSRMLRADADTGDIQVLFVDSEGSSGRDAFGRRDALGLMSNGGVIRLGRVGDRTNPLGTLEADAGSGAIGFTGLSYDAGMLAFAADRYSTRGEPTRFGHVIAGRSVPAIGPDARGMTDGEQVSGATELIRFDGGALLASSDLRFFSLLDAGMGGVISLPDIEGPAGGDGIDLLAVGRHSVDLGSFGLDLLADDRDGRAGGPLGSVEVVTDRLGLAGEGVARVFDLQTFDFFRDISLGDPGPDGRFPNDATLDDDDLLIVDAAELSLLDVDHFRVGSSNLSQASMIDQLGRVEVLNATLPGLSRASVDGQWGNLIRSRADVDNVYVFVRDGVFVGLDGSLRVPGRVIVGAGVGIGDAASRRDMLFEQTVGFLGEGSEGWNTAEIIGENLTFEGLLQGAAQGYGNGMEGNGNGMEASLAGDGGGTARVLLDASETLSLHDVLLVGTGENSTLEGVADRIEFLGDGKYTTGGTQRYTAERYFVDADENLTWFTTEIGRNGTNGSDGEGRILFDEGGRFEPGIGDETLLVDAANSVRLAQIGTPSDEFFSVLVAFGREIGRGLADQDASLELHGAFTRVLQRYEFAGVESPAGFDRSVFMRAASFGDRPDYRARVASGGDFEVIAADAFIGGAGLSNGFGEASDIELEVGDSADFSDQLILLADFFITPADGSGVEVRLGSDIAAGRLAVTDNRPGDGLNDSYDQRFVVDAGFDGRIDFHGMGVQAGQQSYTAGVYRVMDGASRFLADDPSSPSATGLGDIAFNGGVLQSLGHDLLFRAGTQQARVTLPTLAPDGGEVFSISAETARIAGINAGSGGGDLAALNVSADAFDVLGSSFVDTVRLTSFTGDVDISVGDDNGGLVISQASLSNLEAAPGSVLEIGGGALTADELGEAVSGASPFTADELGFGGFNETIRIANAQIARTSVFETLSGGEDAVELLGPLELTGAAPMDDVARFETGNLLLGGDATVGDFLLNRVNGRAARVLAQDASVITAAREIDLASAEGDVIDGAPGNAGALTLDATTLTVPTNYGTTTPLASLTLIGENAIGIANAFTAGNQSYTLGGLSMLGGGFDASGPGSRIDFFTGVTTDGETNVFTMADGGGVQFASTLDTNAGLTIDIGSNAEAIFAGAVTTGDTFMLAGGNNADALFHDSVAANAGGFDVVLGDDATLSFDSDLVTRTAFHATLGTNGAAGFGDSNEDLVDALTGTFRVATGEGGETTFLSRLTADAPVALDGGVGSRLELALVTGSGSVAAMNERAVLNDDVLMDGGAFSNTGATDLSGDRMIDVAILELLGGGMMADPATDPLLMAIADEITLSGGFMYGGVTLDGPVIVESDASIQTTLDSSLGDLIIRGTIDGSTPDASLTLATSRLGGELLEDGELDPEVPFIQITGDIGAGVSLAELNLNTLDPKNSELSREDLPIAANATIVLGTESGFDSGSTSVNVESFRMGRGEKLVAFGDLEITAMSAEIGDITATQDLTITSPELVVLLREAGPVAGGSEDLGVDINAGGALTLSPVTRTEASGDGGGQLFASLPSGAAVVPAAGGFIPVRVSGGLPMDAVITANGIADVAAVGPTNADVSDSIAAAAAVVEAPAPENSPPQLDAEAIADLAEIGLVIRVRPEMIQSIQEGGDEDFAEELAAGAPLIFDLRVQRDDEGQIVTTADRLTRILVDRLLARYRAVFAREYPQDQTAGAFIGTKLDPAITAYDEAAGNPERIDVRAFLRWVVTTDTEVAREAEQVLREVASVLRPLDEAGLGAAERRQVIAAVTRILSVGAVTQLFTAELEALVQLLADDQSILARTEGGASPIESDVPPAEEGQEAAALPRWLLRELVAMRSGR